MNIIFIYNNDTIWLSGANKTKAMSPEQMSGR